MTFTALYAVDEPPPESIAALPGMVVLEFGAPWCGYCIAAQPAIEAALSAQPQVRHIKVEDGRGRALGRAFKVKLWPTLIFLRDGIERARVVRPTGIDSLQLALAQVMGGEDTAMQSP
jgi:thioredoxin 1